MSEACTVSRWGFLIPHGNPWRFGRVSVVPVEMSVNLRVFFRGIGDGEFLSPRYVFVGTVAFSDENCCSGAVFAFSSLLQSNLVFLVLVCFSNPVLYVFTAYDR